MRFPPEFCVHCYPEVLACGRGFDDVPRCLDRHVYVEFPLSGEMGKLKLL